MSAVIRKFVGSWSKHDGKWYIADDENSMRYLHSDGVWRNSTSNGGRYTGYFDTRNEAAECLQKAGER